MFRINLALTVCVFISTVSFGQMSGSQSKFSSDGPMEAPAEPKVKNYSRGGHAASNSTSTDDSGLEALKALSNADTTKANNIGEVIVRKAQKANANDTTYRIALLIGNCAYDNDKLTTPANDVTVLSSSLQNAGFEVTELRNGSQSLMMSEIAKFILKSKKARYSVFYFGGHAINFTGVNYLLPVGTSPEAAAQIPSRTYNLTVLINSIKKTDADLRKDREVLVLIDASRTNSLYPALKIKHQKSVATIGAPHGVMVLQASMNGYNAVTTENTSLFADVFAKEFMLPQTIGVTCANTHKEVFRLSNKMQLPMITGHDHHVKLVN